MKKTITLNGVETEIPQEVEEVGDDLYEVPFSLLRIAEKDAEAEEYTWMNPRHLGEVQGETLGQGFGKQDMQDLYNDITDEGVLLPLICRWKRQEDGALFVQVLDGERRWRCLNRMREKDDKVWSRKAKAWVAASEVYETVSCCVVVANNDKEALRVAFMVSDRSVSWGEGATAKLVKKLRRCKCSDEEILELTKKSFQWLREMDEICGLDETTFGYLADGRINRALALRLAKIEDLDRRIRYLTASYEDAVEHHQEEVVKADEELERAESKEEVAEVELLEAEQIGDATVVTAATEKLEETKEKTRQKRQRRQEVSRPKGKTPNLRAAQAKLGEEEAEDVAQPLRPGKIRQHLETVDTLIKAGGKDADGKEVFGIQVLSVVAACYKAVLTGEEDILKVLKRQKNLQKIQAMRHNDPPPDVADDMEDDSGED